MAEIAAHLTDHGLAPVALRQWVLSVPKRLRWHLHHQPGAVEGIGVEARTREIDWQGGGLALGCHGLPSRRAGVPPARLPPAIASGSPAPRFSDAV
jgi:hypothetical protein